MRADELNDRYSGVSQALHWSIALLVFGQLAMGKFFEVEAEEAGESLFDLQWAEGISYRDVYHQNEVEQSAYNFEHSDVEFLLLAFNAHERQSKHLMQQQLALPAYEQLLKAAHSFNLLDARGAISVTERAAYIGRIRNLARAVAQSYYDSRARLGFPMAPREWVAQIPRKAA